MLNIANSTAASFAELPPVARGHQSGAGEARRQANPFADLPAWAQNDEARALLAQIVAEQPERDRPLTQLATGATASFGYRGKAANRLRQLFDPFIIDRMDWAYRAGFGTPLFHKRRSAVIAYADQHGPDALIARVLAS